MKRCPKCSRTFPDENQKFCTFDGGLLMAEQPTFDPNMTMRATSKDLVPPPHHPSEAPTSLQLPEMPKLPDLSETITSFGTTTFSEAATGPTGGVTSSDLKPLAPAPPASSDLVQPQPPAAQPPPPPSQPAAPPPQHPPAVAPATPAAPVASEPAQASAAAAPKKRSVMPWVLGLLAILVLLGGGGATAAYFLLVKPWLEQQRGGVVVDDKRPVTNENANRNANTSSNPTPGPSAVVKEEPPEFVPPPNAVKFANSRTGLDSKLEEHYIDFSFYYPSAWKKDPKAGAAGNFARIDRSLTEDSIDYPQEKVAVSWYLSNGSFDADKAIFPDRVKDLSAQMAKGLPGFSKTTEGETKVNSLNAYEFRFTGAYTGTKKGDIPYWGRVIFVSPRGENEKNGVTIIMLATKLAPGVAGVDDVGVKGELPMILDSFRFGAK